MIITSIEQLDPNGTYSYADYLTWKFEEYVELLRGKISKMVAPTNNHQRIAGRIFSILDMYLESSRCSAYVVPFDVRLFDKKKSTKDKDIYTVVQPDVCVVCDRKKLDTRGCIGAPDLVVEVLSPSTKKKDLEDKFELYEFNGVKEYWVVSVNDETITIFDLNEQGKYQLRKIYADDESIIHSTSVEGFSVKMERIFSAIR
jgi:Uma2 family endonuclease